MTKSQHTEEISRQIQKIHSDSEKFAKIKGWVMNPNKIIVESIVEGLARNKLMYGKRYCPCRRISGNRNVDKLYICPCRNVEMDVENYGHCHCRLFMK
ncbi:MAG TPA: ferredoxin:thioredoxin reductase [Methanocorpusculum sp.]|nr:ferredoxin:thioredoxin reductase [Methanocorpusculum sp.]HJK02367.1 ferredoxin:thioredoxin reductase [Methanocorpusculum sp.]